MRTLRSLSIAAIACWLGAAAAQPASIVYSIAPNATDSGTQSEIERFQFRDVLPVTLSPGPVATGGNADPIQTYDWRLEALLPGTPPRIFAANASGRTANFTLEPGTYRATLTAKSATSIYKIDQAVVVKEIYIGAFGDSYGSGEGNPDQLTQWQGGFPSKGAIWSDTEIDPTNGRHYSRCHRSHRAASVAFVQWMRQEYPLYPVNLRSVACSGAQIRHGVIGSYAGAESLPSKPADLPPQLDAVALEAQGHKLDAITLSIGGNDVGFAPLALTYAVTDMDANVPAMQVVDDQFRQDNESLYSGSPPVGGFAELATRFKQNDPFKNAAVLLTTYPDILSRPSSCTKVVNEILGPVELGIDVTRLLLALDGVPTPPKNWRSGITRLEMEHIRQTYLLPLNAKLRDAVDGINRTSTREDPKWYVVDGIVESFQGVGSGGEGHGYCGRQLSECPCADGTSWVRTFNDSHNYQNDYLGTLHPNELGHAAIAKQMLATVGNLFADVDVSIAGPENVRCGSNATYEVRWINHGPAVAKEVVAAVSIPGTRIQACDSQADVRCQVTADGSRVALTVPGLWDGEGRAGEIHVHTAQCGGGPKPAIDVTATVNSFTPDAAPANNLVVRKVAYFKEIVPPHGLVDDLPVKPKPVH